MRAHALKLLTSRSAAVGYAACVAAVMTGALAFGDDQADKTAPATQQPAFAAPNGAAPRPETPPGQFIAALRRPSTSEDRIPAEIAGSALLEDGYADVSQSRRVDVTDRDRGWLVPGKSRNAVCHVRAGFMNCPPADEIAARGMSVSVAWRGRAFRVEGVAADGVQAVDIEMADGRVVRERIRNNVFLVRTGVAPIEASWLGPAGPERQALISSQQIASMGAAEQRLQADAARFRNDAP